MGVKWHKYPGIESVSKYVVICIASNHHKNTSAASTGGQNLSLVVKNLLKFTEYKVAVLAIFGNSSYNLTNVNETISKSEGIVIKTDEDGKMNRPVISYYYP